MSLVQISGLTHHFGGFTLFDNLTLSIEHNTRIGLVGRNGCGKTTLLEMVLGRITPTIGTPRVAGRCRIAYLTQEPELPENQTVYQYVSGARQDILDLHQAIRNAEHALAEHNTTENQVLLAELNDRFLALDGFGYENQLEIVLTRLSLLRPLWDRPIKLLSGGEKTRTQLARILLEPFDLLLMDEPTNHLDFSMIFWLEKYLPALGKPYLVISHDRHFLDATVTKIGEIREKRLFLFGGNYSQYEFEKQRQDETQLKQFKQQQKLIAKTEDFIRKNMAGQKVQQAKSRLKMLDKLERIEKPTTESAVKLRFESQGRSGNDVFRLEHCAIGFPGLTLANDVNLNVFYQDRIAIIGRNGCGKTTLLRSLIGEHPVLSGHLYTGASLNIGYYDQMHINLAEGKTIRETIWNLMPGAPQGEVIGYLARFGFYGDDLEKMVDVLSGGEKARLYLSVLIMQKPNLLILDEPTNHLDILTVENLETALQNYTGTVIFVSHDLFFVENVATKKWFFGGGKLEETELPIQDLFDLERKLDKKSDRSDKAQRTANRKSRTNPIILERLMEDINAKGSDIRRTQGLLLQKEIAYADPATYSDPEKIRTLQQEIDSLKEEIEKLSREKDEMEDRYLEMSD